MGVLFAIRAFFAKIVERSATDQQRRGCMLVDAAIGMAPCDPEFRTAVAQKIARFEAFFHPCVAAEQADGTMTPLQSADETARLLLSVLRGVRVLAHTSPQPEVPQGAVDGALGLLTVELQFGRLIGGAGPDMTDPHFHALF